MRPSHPHPSACVRAQPDAAAVAGWPPAALSLSIHAACVVIAWALAAGTSAGEWWPWIAALLAVAASAALRMDWWWVLINGAFVPAVAAALAFDIAPGWFLLAFGVTVVTFWSVACGRVPLFLSSGAARNALATLCPRDRPFQFVDLGCGDGGLIEGLSRVLPQGRYLGVEHAPLPYFAARLRTRKLGDRCQVARRDFWLLSLAGYDVVYAYLSPVPMARLWRKAQAEMRPGTLFVSNSFAVPGRVPDIVVETGDLMGTRLLAWRI